MSAQIALDPLVPQAIEAALKQDWDRALELNRELLIRYPQDIDTMNRLARAFSEVGQIEQARKLYQKVLKADPYNQIARKNLERLSSLKKKGLTVSKNYHPVKADIFLEEPGKTATLSLVDTAMSAVLATLRTGDKVNLVPHRSSVTAVSQDGQRVGKIENGIAKELAASIRAGSRFEAFIKAVDIKKGPSKKAVSAVSIFVREIYRSAKVSDSPLPSTTTKFTPYVREEALGLLAQQAPLPTEADDSIEEIEVRELPSVEVEHDQSLEELAEKEAEESERMDEE